MRSLLFFGIFFSTMVRVNALPPLEGVFMESRTYRHLLFESIEKCHEMQKDPDFWINCYQTVEFHPDGRSLMMWTDILNPGTYRILMAEGRIEVITESPSDGPERTSFLFSQKTKCDLIDEATESVWTWEGCLEK